MTPTYILVHILKVSLVLLNINENVEQGYSLTNNTAGCICYIFCLVESFIIYKASNYVFVTMAI